MRGAVYRGTTVNILNMDIFERKVMIYDKVFFANESRKMARLNIMDCMPSRNR